MIRNQLLCLSFFLLLLSCTADKEGKQSSEVRAGNSRPERMAFQRVAEDLPEGLALSELELDTIQTREGVFALKVGFDLKATEAALTQLKNEGYTSYFIDLAYHSGNRTCLYRDELFRSPEKRKFWHSNRECFLSHPAARRIELLLPFRNLEMKPGNNELTIDIHAYPARFEDQESSLNMKMLDKISGTPNGTVTVKTVIEAPKLYKASFTVFKTKVDTRLADPTKFDVAGRGKGYPDMFWDIHCGNDFLYNSPVEKNKIEYNLKNSSPALLFTEKDLICLEVVDYDNGPFNTQDDVIGNWKFHIRDLNNNKVDTLKFGKLEYLIVQAHVEEVTGNE